MTLEEKVAQREAQLHEAASVVTGLADFGDGEYREALGVLLSSYETEARLSELGWAAVSEQIVGALVGRLVSEQGWRAHPETTGAAIERPIVIVGLPRTGTTAMHHLLAQDPANQGLELWLGISPQPRPPREVWDQNPAFVACDQGTRAVYEAQPQLAAIHFMAADLVDECWHLLRQSFASITFECIADIPTFSRWLAGHDFRPAYARHRDNLRLIGAHDPRRWVLKDPSHLFAPEALFATYPDALVVQTHRDPRSVLPSVCSLNAGFQHGWSTAYDPARLGAAQLDLWSRGIHRFVDARRALPAEQVFDVHFEDWTHDPLAVIGAIYDHFGLELTAAAETRMRAWQDAPSESHGQHRYALEDFGLAGDEIDEVFADYVEAFGVGSRHRAP